MPDPDDSNPVVAPKRGAEEQSARLGARVALGIFTVLSSLFIVSTTWQLCRAVFFLHEPSSSLHEAPAAEPCSRHLRGLAEAVERAITASRMEPSESTATAAFEASLVPEWDRQDAVLEECSADPRGSEAFATVARLRHAGEAFARHRAGDLAQAHADVAVVLGGR